MRIFCGLVGWLWFVDMRLTSEFWVSALLRRVREQHGFAYLTRRGAKEAGAIFILAQRPTGTVNLYAPAPQSVYDDKESNSERFFICLLEDVSESTAVIKLENEIRFDPDIFLISIENLPIDKLPFDTVTRDDG